VGIAFFMGRPLPTSFGPNENHELSTNPKRPRRSEFSRALARRERKKENSHRGDQSCLGPLTEEEPAINARKQTGDVAHATSLLFIPSVPLI
jgi:hypothetical protein